MNHDATGEIQHAALGQPAPAPNPMCDRRIDHQQPQRRKHEHGRKPDALGIGADDQRRGDDRKGHLEHHEDALRHMGARVDGAAGQIGQEDRAKPAEPIAAAREGQAVGHGKPQQRDHGSDGHALDEDRQHVLGLHQPGIEQAQRRQGHQQHQHRGDHQPGAIRPIYHCRAPRPVCLPLRGGRFSFVPGRLTDRKLQNNVASCPDMRQFRPCPGNPPPGRQRGARTAEIVLRRRAGKPRCRGAGRPATPRPAARLLRRRMPRANCLARGDYDSSTRVKFFAQSTS